jgi:pimeloyl-ACP methyl ester carboxylesterase
MSLDTIDGLTVNYSVCGQGPAMLMIAPGGFDSTIQKWSTAGIWKSLRPLETMSSRLELIAYDRRECGLSGGRVEVLSWEAYADQAVALLGHLGRKPAVILGACMGCSIASAIAARHSEWCSRLILHWPVGGYRWRQMGLQRFDAHLSFLKEHTLAEVAARATSANSFWLDPEAGPWIGEIARDAQFRRRFLEQDRDRYMEVVTRSRDQLFSDEFPSGARPAELVGIEQPVLIVPGGDEVHTRSAAYTLRELLRDVRIWDVPVGEQAADPLRERLSAFALGGAAQ